MAPRGATVEGDRGDHGEERNEVEDQAARRNPQDPVGIAECGMEDGEGAGEKVEQKEGVGPEARPSGRRHGDRRRHRWCGL